MGWAGDTWVSSHPSLAATEVHEGRGPIVWPVPETRAQRGSLTDQVAVIAESGTRAVLHGAGKFFTL